MSAYAQHIDVLQQRWGDALSGNGFDAALIGAGARQNYFLDDQAPVFRANPHLAQWLEAAGSYHACIMYPPDRPPRWY